MESLKTLSFAVIKKIIKEEQRTTFHEINKEERWKNQEAHKIVALAKFVGWIDVIIEAWKLSIKKGMWRHIHGDIVSTVM